MSGDSSNARPLVSVIIPAHNAERTLGATVSSVRAQTYRNLEILIVDDGSQDETGAVAKKLSRMDDRITVLQRKNGGVARARNTALAQATGRYVAWLDADDLWHPSKIARQVEVFEQAEAPLAFVYTGYRIIDLNDRIQPNIRPLTDMSGQTLCLQIATNFFSNVSSIMAPLELAREVGGHDARLRDEGIEGAEDMLMQLRLAARGPTGCCRSALVGYRLHDNNMSLNHERSARSNLRVIDLISCDVPDIPEWVLRLARARVVAAAGYLLQKRDFGAAASLIFQLTKQQPLETTAISCRVVLHTLRRSTLRDPAVGENFFSTEPRDAPWSRAMLLTRREEERLRAADAKLGIARPLRAGRGTARPARAPQVGR